MSKTSIEIPQKTKDILKKIAEYSGRSMTKEIQRILNIHAENNIGADKLQSSLQTLVLDSTQPHEQFSNKRADTISHHNDTTSTSVLTTSETNQIVDTTTSTTTSTTEDSFITDNVNNMSDMDTSQLKQIVMKAKLIQDHAKLEIEKQKEEERQLRKEEQEQEKQEKRDKSRDRAIRDYIKRRYNNDPNELDQLTITCEEDVLNFTDTYNKMDGYFKERCYIDEYRDGERRPMEEIYKLIDKFHEIHLAREAYDREPGDIEEPGFKLSSILSCEHEWQEEIKENTKKGYYGEELKNIELDFTTDIYKKIKSYCIDHRYYNFYRDFVLHQFAEKGYPFDYSDKAYNILTKALNVSKAKLDEMENEIRANILGQGTYWADK